MASIARVGPFEVHLLIGRGGQGAVYWGRHAEQGTPVAVKVMFDEAARAPVFIEGFLNEIRQVARMSHPNIILPLDCGTIKPEAEERSEGRLVAGSPYLVMEYAAGGSLRSRLRMGPMGWPHTRRVLLTLLRALAHAHSRRVLHRDLKPENVLLCGAGDLSVDLRLSDFGMAGGEPGTTLASGVASGGTPPYMAPEQGGSSGAVQGPWTDLYALGCMAFEMVTGRVPFREESWRDTVLAHREKPVPPLVPQFSVPAGFEAWVLRLLEKDPYQRFLRAADAIFALENLGEPLPTTHVIEPIPLHPGVSLVDTWKGSISEAQVRGAAFDAELRMPLPVQAPPLPATLAPSQTRRAMDIDLIGAGLGLFEFREPTLLGRDAELELLRQSLAAVRLERRTRVVVISGSRGVGKSWLAHRFAERLDEVGAATVLLCSHGPMPTASAGISSMLANLFRCVGVEDYNRRNLVRRTLGALEMSDPDDMIGILAILGDELTGAGPSLLSQRERNVLLARLLGAIARERTPVIVFDDAHYGVEALSLVRYLLEEQPWDPVPALVVVTLDRDAAERPGPVKGEITALLASAQVRRVELGPLGEEPVRQMMDELLLLGDEVARRIVERAGGNPQFVRWLMAELVRKECLAPNPDGFALRPGQTPALPESLAELLLERLRALTEGGVHPALQVAAAIGQDVDLAEWTAACAALGCEAPRGLREALVAAALATPRDAGWTFCPALVRDALEREALARGTWVAVNDACIRMMESRPPTRDTDQRLGRYLVAAGRLEEGFERLVSGCSQCLAVNDFLRAAELHELAIQALDRLSVPERDERRVRLLLARCRLLLGLGRLEELAAAAKQAAWIADTYGCTALFPEGLRYRGIAALRTGDPLAAEAFLRWAGQLAAAAGLRWEEARALVHQGSLRRTQHRLREAGQLLERAMALFEELADPLGIADATLEAASARLIANDTPADVLIELLRKAQRRFQEVGQIAGEAQCLNALGEVYRRQAQLEEAEACYRRGEQLERRLGSRFQVFPRVNLAYTLLRRGAFSEAEPLLVANAEMSRRSRIRLIELLSVLGAAWCAAVRLDWSETAGRLEFARAGFAELGRFERDAAWAAEQIARLVLRLQWQELVGAAVDLSVAQWRGVQEPERAAEVLGLLSGG